MLIPLSWLKEFVEIKLSVEKLAEKLSSAGLTVEKWTKDGEDFILDSEVTPNRPDWLSVYGTAREVAAVTNSKFKIQNSKLAPKPKTKFELDYNDDPKLCPRTSRIIIKGVKVKPSPEWLRKRLKQVGLRPINNLVDITNYVLWLYGIPLHTFDYDKIRGHKMVTELSKGGEEFRSLDGINYKLPAGAIIIKDLGRVIDLLPLKGGENTAISNETTNVLLHSIVCDPVITRRTSQALGLRSDSSAVTERGVDPNGTTQACLAALEMILELAGGEVASDFVETPVKPYPNWTVSVSHEKIESVLGISVSKKLVTSIFEDLELKTAMKQFNNLTIYDVAVPTFRNDLHIEEDLIEEVGRIIGYDSFPKTLPKGSVPTTKIAYAHDYDFDLQIKQTLIGSGYNEIYSYSLISENMVQKLGLEPAKSLRVDNPISKEYEYLRTSIFGNILEAIRLNQSRFPDVKLFELGKEYKGESCDKAKEEFWIWGAVTGEKFFETKGDVESLLDSLGVEYIIRPYIKEDDVAWAHPGRTATIETKSKEYLGYIGETHPNFLAKFGVKDRVVGWELKYEVLYKSINPNRVYKPISLYPAIIEDITLVVPENMSYQEVVTKILTLNKLIVGVTLVSTLDRNFTFRIAYQDKTRNLTDKDVEPIRKKLEVLLK